MAHLVPDHLPRRASAGEKRVSEILRRLPEDTIVYYEAVISGRRPDFVVISQRLGILVLEVKGWYAGNITHADPQMVTVVREGVAKNVQHPAVQARDYMWRVSDAFQASPLAARLRHLDGPRQGSLLFPLAYGSALSNITRSQAHQHFGSNLEAIFPPPRTLFRDEIIQLEQEPSASIESRLRQFFDPWWNFGGFTESQIKAIRAILHPEAVIAEPSPAQDQDPLELLKILDLKQEQRALEIGSGHRVIYGVAGSGKTMLLLARARFLAEQRPKARILLLCYNRCLAAKLRSVLEKYPQVKVSTFHKLAARFGIVSTNDGDLGTMLLPRLQEISEARRLDAVLIDEGQDFQPDWFTCAKFLLKDPENGDLIIVADGNQGIYRSKAFTWSEVGIHAQGRTYHAKFDLDRNYRNTKPILRLAEQLLPEAEPNPRAEEAIVAPLVAAAECLRDSPIVPHLLPCGNREDEVNAILHITRGLLHGNWLGTPVAPLAPSEIAVVYPRLFHADYQYRTKLIEGLRQLTMPTGVLWINDPEQNNPHQQIGGPELKFQTIHSSKGLEYPAVIVAFADRFAPHFMEDLDERTERRLAFVGATRAETYLAVTWTGRLPWKMDGGAGDQRWRFPEVLPLVG